MVLSWALATREKNLSSPNTKLRDVTQSQECSRENACALSNYSRVQWENCINCRDKGGMRPRFQQRKWSLDLLPSLCKYLLVPLVTLAAMFISSQWKTACRSQHPTSSHMHWNLLSQLHSLLLQLHLVLWGGPLHSSPSVRLTGIIPSVWKGSGWSHATHSTKKVKIK